MPLHNIDFVSFTTYYWFVATDNHIDEYLSDIDTDSEEGWVAEVGEGVPSNFVWGSMSVQETFWGRML